MLNKFKYLILTLMTSASLAYSYEPTEAYTEGYYEYQPEWDSEAYSGVYDAYRYFSAGVGPIVFIPNLGVGYRERHCQLGWDANISFSSLGYVHQLSGNIVGHYYLNPYDQTSPYVGLGLLGSGIFTNKGHNVGTLSTDFVIGKEFERTDWTRHFIEMHVGVPTVIMGSHRSKTMYLPLMYVKYGISF